MKTNKDFLYGVAIGALLAAIISIAVKSFFNKSEYIDDYDFDDDYDDDYFEDPDI